jgi:hypothetical protein
LEQRVFATGFTPMVLRILSQQLGCRVEAHLLRKAVSTDEAVIPRVEGTKVMDLMNRWVRFKVLDIYYPDPIKVLTDLHGNEILTGQVLDLSDSGMQKDAFIVVKVEGIEEPVIVPVERISVQCE